MWIQWESPDDDNSTSFRYAVRIGTEPGASDILYANSITDTSSENYGSTLIDIPGLVTRNNINVQFFQEPTIFLFKLLMEEM